MKKVLAILLIGMIATAASAADTNAQASGAWSATGTWDGGVPTASLSAGIDGGFTVTSSGVIDVAGGIAVGASGSLVVNGTLTSELNGLFMTDSSVSVNGSLDIAAGATLISNGNMYTPAEYEIHAFDAGGLAPTTVTIGAGATLYAKGGIGLGMDHAYNYADVYVTVGADAQLTADSAINPISTDDEGGQFNFGKGDDCAGGGTSAYMSIAGGVDIYAPNKIWHAGGTIEIQGEVWGHAGFYNHNSASPARLELTGAAGATSLRTGDEAGGNSGWMYVRSDYALDLNGLTGVVDDTWYTIVTGWASGGKKYDADLWANPVAGVIGSDPDLRFRVTFENQLWVVNQWNPDGAWMGGDATVQFKVPEPASLAVLSLGGIAALLRKRR